MNHLILVSIFVLSLGLVSCGKSDENKKSSPQTKQTHNLETGATFLDAPYNWIEFGAISKDETYTKTLIFLAPYDGTLSLGLNTYGMGRSCDNTENAYTINSTFKLKRVNEQEYKVIEKPNSMVPSFKLQHGDSMMLELLLSSNANCSYAEINIFATF